MLVGTSLDEQNEESDEMAKGKPVVKVWFMRPKEAWFRLSEEKREELSRKHDKKLEELHAKTIVLCDSRWSNEEWATFGVEEFPNIEAEQEYTRFLEELGHFTLVESKIYLGIPTEFPS